MPPKIVIELDYADVKMDFLDVYNGRKSIVDQPEVSEQSSWRPGAKAGWSKVKADDTARWIRDGYRPPGLVLAAGAPSSRKRTRWRDDGDDLDLTRAWSGDPTPFSSRESGVKPGIRIEFGMSFSGGVKATVVESYGAWLAQLVAGYQASGHDIELVAVYPVSGHYRIPSGQKVVYRVALKRFGQSTDFVAWSPAFSPGGFRHIMFAQMALQTTARGRRLANGIGRPDSSPSWQVSFDGTTLAIQCEGLAREFPAEEMTRRVAAAFTP